VKLFGVSDGLALGALARSVLIFKSGGGSGGGEGFITALGISRSNHTDIDPATSK
jgi:hypothetical protein